MRLVQFLEVGSMYTIVYDADRWFASSAIVRGGHDSRSGFFRCLTSICDGDHAKAQGIVLDS